MNFDILALRTSDETDDTLYPVPGSECNSVRTNAADGTCLPAVTVSELVVREVRPDGSSQRLMRIAKVKARLVMSESRVTVACSKYEKGGGWRPWTVGALPFVLVANAVSKALAAHRRHGKTLVGQVLYGQLLSVGMKPRLTPLGHDRLRLGLSDPTVSSFRGLVLDLRLPRSQSGAELAQTIARRAAGYQLADDGVDDEQRKRLTKLQRALPMQPIAKRYASYFLTDTCSPRGLVDAFELA